MNIFVQFKENVKEITITVFKYEPVLSAQLTTAPTGRPTVTRNFPPAAPPRPTSVEKIS